MQREATFFGSSIGKKVVMAASGLVLFGFVVGHMIGNLQIYLGAEALNEYAEFLRHFLHGQGIWLARAGVLLAVALHIWAATTLTLGSWAARPQGYKRRQKYVESTYASRTMRWGGPIVLIFIIYHLLHFTTGQAHGEFIHGDIYHNVVIGFSVWWVSAFYIIAMLVLGLHLYHGISSMLQTLGLSHPRYNGWRSAIALLVAVAVVVGNISIPVAVLTGFVS